MTTTISRRALTQGALAAGMLTALGATADSAVPEAVTRQGRVRGFTHNGAAVFLGLPYGADTSGANRFRPPQPPASWQGVRDATKPGHRAPQVKGPPPPREFLNYFAGGRADELTAMNEPMGENCLIVNVITPAADKRRRPVLFYIHGGGFTGGSGLTMTLGDQFVVREDVVLVTVNHRLGALGYMYLGDVSSDLAEGNPGMLDLVAALRWVRDNIAEFGGDPEKVTIFGESGGGVKVGYLLSMPQAKGLFRAAIIQSGLFPEPLARDRATIARRTFMEKVGAADIAALRALPYEKFVGPGTPGNMPAYDGRTLMAQPWAQAPAAAADVPLIIGYCKDELTLFALGDPALFKLEWADVPGRLAKALSLPPAAAERVVATYRAAFPKDDPSDGYFRISSDGSFGRAMVTMADRKAAQRPPVYFYRMELDTRLPPGLRAIHTAELPMTVGLSPRPDTAALTKQISATWAAFARSGDPNHAGLPTWKRYDSSSQNTMIFDITSRSGLDPQSAPRASLLEALAGVPLWNPL
ncbi:carboxylic ester hydrolase [Steroidobacter agaridevorans]|uniref:Carboxylic ester hydrolase n=1 Tax=Steroidobacter agaridevorans TaxID=2695856 RepID=A0A829YGH5_9GAMM|nr:carboxylesterase family protein [Steroidobacter agaridevorans]GFE82427.1 carboxylic ester hydrolase [Steroidobacter agaridevorans]